MFVSLLLLLPSLFVFILSLSLSFILQTLENNSIMTFRNRRGRAHAFAAKHSSKKDAQLYETLQRQRRHRTTGVSRPLLAGLLLLWFFRKSMFMRSGSTTPFRAADIDATSYRRPS